MGVGEALLEAELEAEVISDADDVALELRLGDLVKAGVGGTHWGNIIKDLERISPIRSYLLI